MKEPSLSRPHWRVGTVLQVHNLSRDVVTIYAVLPDGYEIISTHQSHWPKYVVPFEALDGDHVSVISAPPDPMPSAPKRVLDL